MGWVPFSPDIEQYICACQGDSLGAEEEAKLIYQLKNADDELTKEHCKLKLFNVAVRMIPRCINSYVFDTNNNPDDYFTVCGEAIVYAIKCYAEKNISCRFTSYVWAAMKNALIRHSRSEVQTIIYPPYVLKHKNRYLEYNHKYRADKGFEPSAEEVAKELGVTKSIAVTLMAMDQINIVSLDNVDAGAASLPNPEEALVTNITIQEIDLAMDSCLSDMDKKIMQMRYPKNGEKEYSCKEIAEELGIAHAAVRKRVSRARQKIKKHIEETCGS